MIVTTNPPIPHEPGSVTFSAAEVAMAASAAVQRLLMVTLSRPCTRWPVYTHQHFHPASVSPAQLVWPVAEMKKQYLSIRTQRIVDSERVGRQAQDCRP